MNPYAYSVLAFGVGTLLIAVLVWVKLNNRIGFHFFLFSAFSGLWGLFASQAYSNNFSYSESLFFSRLSNFFALWIGPAWYSFALIFSKADKKNIVLYAFCLTAFLLSFYSFSDLYLANVYAIAGFKYHPKCGPLYHFFTTVFFLSVGLGYLRLFSYLKSLTEREKKQCLWLIYSTGAGFLGGGLTFFPIYGIPLPQQAMFLMPLYPLFMGLAMMKYGLLNEESLIIAAHKDKLAALGILTASINHEIRAPLFVIRGTVETETDSSKIKERVISQVDRLTGIVSRLTYFAKKGVEEEAKIEPIDLKEVLADIRPLFQHQLNYQNIEFTQDIPADLPKVMADRRYLEEILFNLILNACQALRETENPEIELKAYSPPMSSQRKLGSKIPNQVWNDKTVVIEISDNGSGIPPDQLKNIFKPFHTTKQEGTGLGLYITKQLVEKCGGKIEAKSQLGHGAEFVVRFNSK
ncbi:MAG TPA: ATP-binding protein [Candidatus Omnitrophota bacterium]|nr:ATP-binding protein [Candidatus Omnitrophota bacterium]